MNALKSNIIVFHRQEHLFLFILLFSLLLSIAIAITVELHCIVFRAMGSDIENRIPIRVYYFILSLSYPHLVSCYR